jgi:hypothetical protein
MFFPAADTIAFAEGGTESARFDSNGRLGIGTVSPTVRLEVADAGTGTGELRVTGSSNGFQIYTDNSNTTLGTYTNIPLVFRTNTTERMRITSAGLVGIGTNNPQQLLDLYGSGGLTLIQIQGTAGVFGYFGGANTSGSGVLTSIPRDMIIRGEGSNILFSFSNVEAARINANSNFVLKGGSTGATGIGITFPAAQSASSDANCLDDYEEGTWTPTYAGSSSNPTVTYAVREGIYTKVGNLVTVSFFISASAASGGSGDIRITGFPFSTVSTALRQGAGVVNYQNLTASTSAGALIYMDPSTATGVLQTFYCDSGVGVSALTSGTFNKNLSCTFTYRVA